MSTYLLIESRAPFESREVHRTFELACRATLEEQDDPVIWLTHALKGAGAEIAVLLRGAAVNYATPGQDASGLQFGARPQTQPPRPSEDLAGLVKKGVPVFFIEEDVRERGLAPTELIVGVRPISRAAAPGLFSGFDHIWKW